MSLRPTIARSPSQPSSSSTAPKRKSSSKRPLVHSDDDVELRDTASTQRTKRARTADTDRPASPTDDSDMDVDVDGLARPAPPIPSAVDDSRFLPEDAQPSFPPKKKADPTKKRKKSTSLSAPPRKKPQVVYSDDEETDGHMELDSVEDDLSDSALPLADASDDDVQPDSPPKRGGLNVKARGAFKGKPGKAKAAMLKRAKPKGPKEKELEFHMKDERKLPVPPATTSRASSAAAQSQPSDLFSHDDVAPSNPLPDSSHPAKDPMCQTIPKKRKLPPIKKTKAATAAPGAPTPAATTQKPLPPPAQEIAKPSLPASEQRKQALTGVRDIDLADSKIYAELFKGAGGNTPRSGLKNADERRKELDKMRDEAKARRAEEAKFTFDLQAQADKIARFEQRMRAENSTVLHPNFLAAKFRDEWELERRDRRATPKEEGEA